MAPTWAFIRTQLPLLSHVKPDSVLEHAALLDHDAVDGITVHQGADGYSIGVGATFKDYQADKALLDTLEALVEASTRDLLRSFFHGVPHASRFYDFAYGRDGRLVFGMDGVTLEQLRSVIGDAAPKVDGVYRLGIHISNKRRQLWLGKGDTERAINDETALVYTHSVLPAGVGLLDALTAKGIQTDAAKLGLASAMFEHQTPRLTTRADRPGGLLTWTCA